MTSLKNLFRYGKSGVASPDMTDFDKLLALQLAGGGFPVASLSGQPPLSFKADGTPLISLSMLGNGQQTGTPTPDNPIQPEFVGVRTGNLFNINATPTKYNQSTIVTVDGQTLTITGTWYIYYEIDVVPNTDYYIKWTIDYAEIEGRGAIAILTTSGQTIHNQSTNPYSFNSGENQRIRLYIYAASSTSGTVRLSKIMLNSGSTALPYEPFGWAEKITCAGQTVPVYLGQTQTVRRIKKLVLTGEENWQWSTGDQAGYVYLAISNATGYAVQNNEMCSHFVSKRITGSNNEQGIGVQNKSAPSSMTAILVRYTGLTTDATTFKSYLAQQYANGTPVTVWYVLAEPETAIVNEPLAKIGDYADELSSTDAAVTIPTAKGANTLTVETELQPSEISITGHIEAIT